MRKLLLILLLCCAQVVAAQEEWMETANAAGGDIQTDTMQVTADSVEVTK